MARYGYIPHDQDREDQKAEEKAERRALRKAPVEDSDDEDLLEQFGGQDPNDDEFESVEAFAEFLLDDDRKEFTHFDLACLNVRLNVARHTLRRDLEGYGFRLRLREKLRVVRGFSSWDHNRWQEPC